MAKRKIPKATMAARRKSRLKTHKAQDIMNVYNMATLPPDERAFEIKLKQLSDYVKTHHVHPEITNKRVGCKYSGWVQISACNRKGNDYMLNRIRAMQFFGDWCPEKKFDEIIPDILIDDGIKRVFYLDFFMFDVLGEAYDIPTQKIFNPRNMADLNNQVAALVKEVGDNEGFLFDFDTSYVEIRA